MQDMKEKEAIASNLAEHETLLSAQPRGAKLLIRSAFLIPIFWRCFALAFRLRVPRQALLKLYKANFRYIVLLHDSDAPTTSRLT